MYCVSDVDHSCSICYKFNTLFFLILLEMVLLQYVTCATVSEFRLLILLCRECFYWLTPYSLFVSLYYYVSIILCICSIFSKVLISRDCQLMSWSSPLPPQFLWNCSRSRVLFNFCTWAFIFKSVYRYWASW